MERIIKTIKAIKPADEQAIESATVRQAMLAKPPGSLGGLEEISIKMAGITGTVCNRVDKTCVAVFCADNGVVAEGVASAPQTVTMAQTINFTKRLTGVGALAEAFGSELLIVDMGVKYPIPRKLYDQIPLRDTHKIIDRRLRTELGETWNIAREDAMTKAEAIEAICTGIEMADAIADNGYELMGIGEMGIGNTTTSAALLSAITGLDSEETVGRGGGVNDEGFERKKEIVDFASERFRVAGGILQAAIDQRFDLMIEALARMGGFDICAMAGAFLGASARRIPVVIDGYISATAALVAYVMEPKVKDYMIPSHESYERGYAKAMEILGLKPFLSLEMRLGEGSGCPIAFQIIKGACDVMTNMATFDEARIDDDYLEEVRSEEK
ncbi:MAG: nicotinate-nucleotide--dimethylbenzimidazole phosphoribosyltransferase, partial [Bacillota bacterium]|nr:nicotinate-nucleotide--dimethylbenzimidazole phosphoribosyltransferase [Bacillota bacterium]